MEKKCNMSRHYKLQQPDTGPVYGRVQHIQHTGAAVWVLLAGLGAARSLWMKARHLWARH